MCKEAFGEDNLLESYVFFCHVFIDINTEFSATSAKDNNTYTLICSKTFKIFTPWYYSSVCYDSQSETKSENFPEGI